MDSKQWPADLGAFMEEDVELEACYRSMVLAGITWLDNFEGNIDPTFRVAGGLSRISSDSAAGRALMQTVQDATFKCADGGEMRCGEIATSYAYHRLIAELLTYQRLGWDEYLQQLREYTEAQSLQRLDETQASPAATPEPLRVAAGMRPRRP